VENRDHFGGGIRHQLKGDIHLVEAVENRDHLGRGVSHQLKGDVHLS
jgi:hypothetical protein